MMQYPFPKLWWISEGKVLGGGYPGSPDPDTHVQRITSLLDMGIGLFINLQAPNETGHGGKPFVEYTSLIKELAQERQVSIKAIRIPVTDQSIPTVEIMNQIIGRITQAVESGIKVYVHCWGGNGRTGTVAGCWLVKQGYTPQQAFDKMAEDRQGLNFTFSAPENRTQRSFVCQWAESQQETI